MATRTADFVRRDIVFGCIDHGQDTRPRNNRGRTHRAGTLLLIVSALLEAEFDAAKELAMLSAADLTGRHVYSVCAVDCTDRRVTYVHKDVGGAKKGHRTSARGVGGQIVGLAICPAVALKARLLSIVSAEFVTEELAAWGAPRMQSAVHGRQRLDAERATYLCVGIRSGCAHGDLL
jgi:hypothetical protein